jgi:hypothetical protein
MGGKPRTNPAQQWRRSRARRTAGAKITLKIKDF